VGKGMGSHNPVGKLPIAIFKPGGHQASRDLDEA